MIFQSLVVAPGVIPGGMTSVLFQPISTNNHLSEVDAFLRECRGRAFPWIVIEDEDFLESQSIRTIEQATLRQQLEYLMETGLKIEVQDLDLGICTVFAGPSSHRLCLESSIREVVSRVFKLLFDGKSKPRKPYRFQGFDNRRAVIQTGDILSLSEEELMELSQ